MSRKSADRTKHDSDHPPLIFDWRTADRRGSSLIKWTLVTLVGMTAFSYAFKVIYPQPQRAAPSPQKITVLNPADPAMRRLLHRVADKDFLVIPDSKSSDEVSLDDHTPVFHPSYENHQFQLQDLPHPTFTVPEVRLLDPTAPLLPPPDLSKLKKPAPMPAQTKNSPRMELVFEGALAGRKILHAPDLSALRVADPSAWRFHLGVDGNGRIKFALPLSTGEPVAQGQQLLQLLSELRFAPTDGQAPADDALAWDNASFQWITPTAP